MVTSVPLLINMGDCENSETVFHVTFCSQIILGYRLPKNMVFISYF